MLVDAGYTDLTDDASTSALAIVTCQTRNLQPHRVSWLKNGEPLLVNGKDYEVFQVLHSRNGSVYNSSLVIRDVLELVDTPSYTCHISSQNYSINLTERILTSIYQV